MSYYSVKDGIIRQSDDTMCSESTVKRAMMNGGSILYDMYQNDILFLPRGVPSNRPIRHINWNKVISVFPTEISKVDSIITVAKAVKDNASSQSSNENKRRVEEAKAKREAEEVKVKADKRRAEEAKAKREAEREALAKANKRRAEQAKAKREALAKVENIDINEYDKYANFLKLADNLNLSKLENFTNFETAFNEFKGFRNKQTLPRALELIEIIRREYKLIPKAPKPWPNCEKEIANKNCTIDSQVIDTTDFTTIHNFTCTESNSNKEYIVKVQLYGSYEDKVNRDDGKYVFNNEVCIFKQLQENQYKYLYENYIIKFIDSWTCLTDKKQEAGYIWLEKVGKRITKSLEDGEFTDAKFNNILNILENFHDAGFIHFNSNPINYYYKDKSDSIVLIDFTFTSHEYNGTNIFNIIKLYDYYIFLLVMLNTNRLYVNKDFEIENKKYIKDDKYIKMNQSYINFSNKIITIFIENSKNYDIKDI